MALDVSIVIDSYYVDEDYYNSPAGGSYVMGTSTPGTPPQDLSPYTKFTYVDPSLLTRDAYQLIQDTSITLKADITYVDASLIVRDTSINDNKRLINQLDASVIRIDAYQLIQDTSIHTQKLYDTIQDSSIFKIKSTDASIAALRAYNLIQDTSIHTQKLYDTIQDSSIFKIKSTDASIIRLDAYQIIQDTSFYYAYNLLPIHDVSIGVLTAYNLIQDTSIHTQKLYDTIQDSSIFKIKSTDASVVALRAYNLIQDTSITLKTDLTYVDASLNAKAPTAHASSETTYGLATDALYGHIKIQGDIGLNLNSGSLSITYGDGSNEVCEGNDIRLSDSREPESHALGGEDGIHITSTLNNLNDIIGGSDLDTVDDERNPKQHDLLSKHTGTGLTAGDFLRATGETTFDFETVHFGTLAYNLIQDTSIHTQKLYDTIQDSSILKIKSTDASITALRAYNLIQDTSIHTQKLYDTIQDSSIFKIKSTDASITALRAYNLIQDTSIYTQKLYDTIQDSSIFKIKSTDASVVALRAYNLIQDTSIYNLDLNRNASFGLYETKTNLTTYQTIQDTSLYHVNNSLLLTDTSLYNLDIGHDASYLAKTTDTFTGTLTIDGQTKFKNNISIYSTEETDRRLTINLNEADCVRMYHYDEGDTDFYPINIGGSSATTSGLTILGNGDVEIKNTLISDTFGDAVDGLAPASGGGTTNFLRADGTWVPTAGGGGGSPITISGTPLTTQVAFWTGADSSTITGSADLTWDGGTLQIDGDLTINSASPIINFIDTDTGADTAISAESGVGSLFLQADINSEELSSLIQLQVDGDAVATFNGDSESGLVQFNQYTDDNAILHINATGEIETDTNFTWNGNKLNVTGDTSINGQLLVRDAAFPPFEAIRPTAITNSMTGAIKCAHETSGDMADGFGAGLYFGIKDPGADNNIAYIGAIRDGADTDSKLILGTRKDAVFTTWLDIDSDGSVNVGGLLTAASGDSGEWNAAYVHSEIAGGNSVHVSTTENTNWDTAYTKSHDRNLDTTLASNAVAKDHGTAATDQIINVCYGTGSPPTASTTTEGTLFIKYTA